MSALPGQPSLSEVSAFLLDLHVRSHDLGYREMQRSALEGFAKLVPFDSGVLAMGSLQGSVPLPHDVLLDRLDPSFMESWERIKHEDRIVIEAMRCASTTISCDVERGPLYDGLEAVKEHQRRMRIRHVLCTTQVDPGSNLYWVMVISRADEGRPFTEAERTTKEIVAPHIVTASRRARLGQLRAASRLVDGHGQATALLNRSALILEAEPGLSELLSRAWPSWSGPWMPRDLWDAIARESSLRLVRGPLVLRFNAVEEGLLLHVRESVPADALTSREREIAKAFSLGDTFRQIAEKLDIAPNTVRRHLTNVYEKLGISSKVELDRMTRGID